MRHAERIAINRTVAGLHFPADSVAGMVLAQTLSEFYVARCAGNGKVWTRTFSGPGFRGDFSYQDVLEMRYPKAPGTSGTDKDVIIRSDKPVEVGASDLLGHVWRKAVAEWRQPGDEAGGGER
jgi:hypothetical protein